MKIQKLCLHLKVSTIYHFSIRSLLQLYKTKTNVSIFAFQKISLYLHSTNCNFNFKGYFIFFINSKIEISFVIVE